MFKYLVSLLVCATHILQASEDSLKFKEISLSEIERIAIQNNQELNIQAQEVESYKMLYFQAISQYLPQIDYTASASEMEVAASNGQHDTYSSAFNLSQTIFSLQTIFEIAQAHTAYASRLAFYEEYLNDLIYNIRTGYYRVVLYHEQIEVARTQLALFQEQLRLEKEKLKVGESTLYDVEQTKVRVAESLTFYHESVEKWKVSQNTLIFLMGVDPQEVSEFSLFEKEIPIRSPLLISKKLDQLNLIHEERVIKDLEIQKEQFQGALEPLDPYMSVFSDEEINEWEEKAIHQRPKIKVSALQQELAKEKLSAKKSKYLPVVNGFGSYSSPTTAGGGFSHLQYNWSCGVSLNWQLFDGLSREFSIQQYISEKIKADLDYDKNVHATLIDVKNNFFKMDRSLLNYFAANEGLIHSKLALEQAKQRLDLGVITPISYRETVLTYTQTWQNLNQASYELIDTYFTLEKLVGAYTERKKQ